MRVDPRLPAVFHFLHEGRTSFAQLLDCLPQYEFDRCVAIDHGNRRVRKLPAYEPFLALAFAQRTGRESLRDIETGLAAFGPKIGSRRHPPPIARSPLAGVNENRDWRVFAGFATRTQARTESFDYMKYFTTASARIACWAPVLQLTSNSKKLTK